MSHVPELAPHCGSWVVSRKETGEAIGEFFDRKIVERFNPEKCRIETTLQYLGRINQEIARQSNEHAKSGTAASQESDGPVAGEEQT